MKLPLLFVFCFILVLGVRVSGQSPEKNTTTRALILGISDYQDENISDLRYAHIDANAFANWFLNQNHVSKDNIRLYLNEEASLGNFAAAIDWLLTESEEGDQAIIYFSGHGDMEAKILNQLGFLLLWDSPAKAYITGALSVDILKQVITTLSVQKKTKVLLIVDACRSGKLAGNNIIGTQLTSNNLSKQYAGEQKILSCQADQYSIEGAQWGGGRGVFSWHLINGLSGLADSDGNKKISLLEIERFLEKNVMSDVAPISQIPFTTGDKFEWIAEVDEEIMAALQTGALPPTPSLSRVMHRGLQKEVLENADTTVLELMNAFQLALDEKRLLEPKDHCAEAYYNQLVKMEAPQTLQNYLRRNLAATFQENAQQAVNSYLNADPSELEKMSHSDDKYRLYPLYLGKAAELLGPEHPIYPSLIAKKLYFEGLNLRLFYDIRSNDSLYQAALEKQEQAMNIEPNAPHVFQEMGLLYRTRSEDDKASSFFQKAIELTPTWITPYYNLREIYSKQGKNQEAYDLFKEAYEQLSLNTANIKHLNHNLASYADDLGKQEEAEALLKENITTTPDFMDSYFRLSTLYKESQRFDEAEALHEKIMDLFPDEAASYYEAGLTKFAMGKVNEGKELCEKGLQLQPYWLWDYRRLAGNLLNNGLEKEGWRVLENAVQIYPNYHNNYTIPASFFRSRGYFEEAEQLIKIIRYLSPDDKVSAFDLFSLYVQFHQWEKASSEFSELSEDSSSDPYHLEMSGRFYILQKEIKKADSLFSQACDLKPGDIWLCNNIALWLAGRGNFDLATKYLNRSIEINAEHGFAQAFLMLLNYHQGKDEEAKKVIDTWRAAHPGSNFLSDLELVFQHLKGSNTGLRADYQKLALETPSFTMIWEFIEDIHHGQYAEAVRVWEEFEQKEVIIYLVPYYLRALLETGQQEAVFKTLNETDLVFINYYLLTTHPVLEPLRALPEFREFLTERFPEKFNTPLANMEVKLKKDHPHRAYFCRLMGYYHRHNERPTDAIHWLEESLKTEPDHSDAKLYLADLYLKTGYIEKAKLMAPESFHSEGLAAQYVAGTVYFRLEQLEKAATNFQKYVNLFKGHRNPNNRVGSFYKNHGTYSMAISYLEEAIRLNPNQMPAWQNLAITHFFSNDHKKAFDLLEEAIKKEPGKVGTHAVYAFLRYLHDPQNSLPYFQKVNALAPGFANIWISLEWMRSDQFEQADEGWKKMNEEFGDWWLGFARYEYLKMKVRQGDTQQVLELLKENMKGSTSLYFHSSTKKSYALGEPPFTMEMVTIPYSHYASAPALKPLLETTGFRELMKRYTGKAN